MISRVLLCTSLSGYQFWRVMCTLYWNFPRYSFLESCLISSSSLMSISSSLSTRKSSSSWRISVRQGSQHPRLLAHLLLSILLFVFWPLLLEKSPETPGAEDSNGDDQDCIKLSLILTVEVGLVSPDIRAMTSHLLSPVLLTTVSKSGIPSLSDITRKY